MGADLRVKAVLAGDGTLAAVTTLGRNLKPALTLG